MNSTQSLARDSHGIYSVGEEGVVMILCKELLAISIVTGHMGYDSGLSATYNHRLKRTRCLVRLTLVWQVFHSIRLSVLLK